MAKAAFWKTGWFPAGLATLVLLLAAAGGLLRGPERLGYDAALRAASRQPDERIAIIGIDQASLAEFGPLPWPADLPARLIERLAGVQAKLIVDTLPFAAPNDPARVYLGRVRDIVVQALADGQPTSPALSRIAAVLDEAGDTIDPERRLAESYGRAGNVLLPLTFGTAGQRLAGRAAAVGDWQAQPDSDGVVRRLSLLVRDGERLYPALALAVAARALDLDPADLAVASGRGLRLGKRHIPTDGSGAVHPFFYRDATQAAFPVDAFSDVLSGRIPVGKYAGKIVLLGVTAPGASPLWTTPLSPAVPPVLLLAQETSGLLQGDLIAVPRWGPWLGMGAMLLVGLYLALLVPRLAGGMAALASALVLGLLLGGEVGLMLGAGIWLPLVGAALLLLLGHPAVALSRRLAGNGAGEVQGTAVEQSNRRLGLAFLAQGQLDLAFDKLRHCPMDADLMAHMYDLARGFEDRRQFARAAAAFRHMAEFDPEFRDLAERLARPGGTSEPPVEPATAAAGDGAPATLGRYRLEQALGKGAMGVVYRGRDPQMNRLVAIKTMALAREFEPDELAEVKQRFFREAETAGRLSHPNIVTMYDAGESGELAYIAMEYLPGCDLVRHVRPDALLPLPVVLSIVARVADALDYAHRQNVVHRDIKPANIMYEPVSDQVKVTDFGIARITDSTRTRSGMVLGTPSFMSPEQLAGKRIDGRSDLFSLGVTLYQLCCGQAPFVGESLAQLMYRIANEAPAEIAALRPDLPADLLAVVARALSKNADQRYQRGSEMAADLRRCLAHWPPIVAQTDEGGAS